MLSPLRLTPMSSIGERLSDRFIELAKSTLPLHQFAYQYCRAPTRRAAAVVSKKFTRDNSCNSSSIELLIDEVTLRLALNQLGLGPCREIELSSVARIVERSPLLVACLYDSLGPAEKLMLDNSVLKALNCSNLHSLYFALLLVPTHRWEHVFGLLKHGDILIRRRAWLACARLDELDPEAIKQAISFIEEPSLLDVLVDALLAHPGQLPSAEILAFAAHVFEQLPKGGTLLKCKLLELMRTLGDTSTRSLQSDEPALLFELSRSNKSVTINSDPFLCASTLQSIEDFELSFENEYVARREMDLFFKHCSAIEYISCAKELLCIAIDVWPLHSFDFIEFLIDSAATKIGENNGEAVGLLIQLIEAAPDCLPRSACREAQAILSKYDGWNVSSESHPFLIGLQCSRNSSALSASIKARYSVDSNWCTNSTWTIPSFDEARRSLIDCTQQPI